MNGGFGQTAARINAFWRGSQKHMPLRLNLPPARSMLAAIYEAQ
jgi:hypothetical protein